MPHTPRLLLLGLIALGLCACKQEAPPSLEGPVARARDVVVAFASPAALENGRSAARERIVVLVAPADGSAPKQVFTGCLPGLTQNERDELAKNENRLKSWAVGGEVGEIDIAAKEFSGTAVGTLMQALRTEKPASGAGVLRSETYCKIEGLPPAMRRTIIIVDERSLDTGKLAATDKKNSLFTSLAATRMFRTSDSTSRIVLVSDDLPKQEAQDVTLARKAALADAAGTPVDFGNSEIVMVGKGGNDDTARAYLQMYLLRLNGKLVSWSADPSGATPTPTPSTLRRYVGTAQYPGSPEGIIRIRLAMDSDGKLVNSWLILTGSPYERAIPLTGQGVCNEAGDCKLRADNEGFAYVWVAARGQQGDVQFDNEAPFGGMREWTLETSGNGLKGEVFDSAVSQVGTVPGNKSIAIQASLDQKANY